MKEKGAIKMTDQLPLREKEPRTSSSFMGIPDYDRSKLNLGTIKGSQLCRPLFEVLGRLRWLR